MQEVPEHHAPFAPDFRDICNDGRVGIIKLIVLSPDSNGVVLNHVLDLFAQPIEMAFCPVQLEL
jgi:hypothetical protein